MDEKNNKEVIRVTTKAQKWGNSLGVRLPQQLTEKFGVENGSELEVKEGEKGIIIKPVKHEPTLDELLAQVTDENRHDYIDFGKPKGKEIW